MEASHRYNDFAEYWSDMSDLVYFEDPYEHALV